MDKSEFEDQTFHCGFKSEVVSNKLFSEEVKTAIEKILKLILGPILFLLALC